MTKSFSTTFMIAAVAYFVLGLALVIWPATARLVICYALGILLILYGLGRTAAQWNSRGFLSLGSGYLLGLVCLLLGLLLIIRTEAILSLFGTVVGLLVMADSLVKLQVSYQLRRNHPGSARRNTLCALVTFLLGLLMLFNIFKALDAMTVFLGVGLMLDGAVNFMIGLDVRRYLHDTITLAE